MYSNRTPNLELPQWCPQDHPDFIIDINEAFESIDENVNKALVDNTELKETVDAMAVRMTTIEEGYAEMKEKVDNLVELDQNPTFVALQERVAATEVDIQQLKVITGTHTETLAQVRQNLTDMQAMLQTHADELNEHHQSIEALVNLTGKLNTEFGELQTQFEILEQQVDDNTDRIVILEQKQAKTEGDVNALTERVAQNNSEISTLESKMEVVEENINTLLDNDASQSSDIAALTTDVDAVKADIATMKPEVADLKDKVTALENSSSTGEQDIAKLKTDVAKNTEDIGEIQNSIDTINQTDAVQNKNISDLSGRVDAIEAGGGGTTPDLSAFEARVKVVEDDQGRQDADIAALQASQATQDTDITELETKVQTNKTELDSMDMRVETLEDDNVQTKADVEGLTTTTQGNQVAIGNLDTRVTALEAGGSEGTDSTFWDSSLTSLQCPNWEITITMSMYLVNINLSIISDLHGNLYARVNAVNAGFSKNSQSISLDGTFACNSWSLGDINIDTQLEEHWYSIPIIVFTNSKNCIAGYVSLHIQAITNNKLVCDTCNFYLGITRDIENTSITEYGSTLSKVNQLFIGSLIKKKGDN